MIMSESQEEKSSLQDASQWGLCFGFGALHGAKAEGAVGIPWLMSWLCLWGVFSHQDWRSHV